MKELSISSKENSNESFKSFRISSKHAKLSEKKGRPNIHQDFTSLTSQLQMMSESIAACQIFSTHQCFQKERATNKKSKKWMSSSGENFEEGNLELWPNGDRNDVIVDFVIHNKDFLHLRKSKTFISKEQILTKSNFDESERRLETYASSSNASREISSKNPKVRMYDYRQVDSRRLLQLLEKELNVLAELTPSVVWIISKLTQNIFHCQGCLRCRERITPSLPWILNRIQSLIRYVTVKRKKPYLRPKDFSYLGRNYSKSSEEEKVDSSSSSSVKLIPVTLPTLIGKLEKVDPVAISENSPGVQLLLEVKPQLRKKRFFYRARSESQSKWVHRGTFPVVCLKERESAPVVEVLKSTAKPRIVWEKKQAVTSFKEFGTSCRVVHLRNLRIAASVTVALAKGIPITYEKTSAEIIFEQELIEKDPDRTREKSLMSILINQREWNVGRVSSSTWKEKLNAKETPSKKHRENSIELVRDFLGEAEVEMQAHRVNELQEEVKELKDLMLEVHKNQTELGKLLLEKNIFSQLMIKLTDPKMLEEENKALKKASNANAPSTSSSTLALQMKVDSLKRKCTLKNRLIVTLLRGLRSNVPKELWEEMVSYAFDDSETMNEFNSEKINEFIRQTSLFLTNEEKQRKLAPSSSRTELQSTEEEPKEKGIMGAEVEDSLKNLTCYENQVWAKSKGVSSRLEDSPSKIRAFPVLNVPDYNLRKLENQISILYAENERLWLQVNQLRELLKYSVNELTAFESGLKVGKIRTAGKTINLMIHIAEKDVGRPKVEVYFPRSEMEIADARSKSSPAVGISQSESITAIHEAERENSPYESDRKRNHRAKSDRRRSENDLNFLDDVNPNLQDYKEENEKLHAAFREKMYSNSRVQGLVMRTPHSSAHEMFQSLKPVVWVPSKHVIPEVSDIFGAGPSRKHVEMTNLMQKPSLMELGEFQAAGMYDATMSNERELQTIPENDPDLSPTASLGISQAIQRLRTRVRSLHKDMTVLRSKNDRINKLLDRLMDDIVENNHNYEELESSLCSLRSRLG